jgi:hypothetical protein
MDENKEGQRIMNDNDERTPSREPEVTPIDALRRRRGDDSRLVSEALERSVDGTDARIDGLLDSVPQMMAEAQRRRRQAGQRDTLTASIPAARLLIPRLAAVAALLVAVSVALLMTGSENGTASTSSFDDLLVAGNGVSDEMIVESILGPEEQP